MKYSLIICFGSESEEDKKGISLMKRIGKVFDKICDIENIKIAINKAKRPAMKHHSKEVEKVINNIDYYANEIREMLINRTYKVSKYNEFIVHERKERKVYSLPFYPDRIIQWATMLIIKPLIVKKLITSTYSSIEGRGLHRAVGKLRYLLEENDYVLQLDIKKYYPSISQEYLLKDINKIFKDKSLIWLLELIIKSHDKGIPIGNFTSQYFGNIHLNNLDHFIKEKLKLRYIRYMDDMVILGNKEELLNAYNEIKRMLNEKGLRLKSYKLFSIKNHSINFCGYLIFTNHLYIRDNIKKSLNIKRNRIIAKQDRGIIPTKHNIMSYESVKGWVKKCKTNYGGL